MDFLEMLGRLSKQAHMLISFSLLVVIGAIDYGSGYEFRMELFYLLPIAYASWFNGQRIGILFSLLSIISIVLSDMMTGKPYTHFSVELWNGAMYFVFYVIVTTLLKLRTSMQQRENLIEELDDALRQNEELISLLPVCANCKKVRDDEEYRSRVHAFVARHPKQELILSLCPDCSGTLGPGFKQSKPSDHCDR